MATPWAMNGVPVKLAIGPYSYIVDFDGQSSYDYGYLGVHLGRSRRIRLDDRQSDTELPQTLLHEVLHALGSAFEINEWRGHKIDNNGKVIDQIDLMASALLQFMRGNRDVVKWLCETE